MNSPCDADYKNMKEIHFRPFWAVFDFLSTMFQVMYYLHYRFLRPVLSCVMSVPSELSISKKFWPDPEVFHSLHGVAHITLVAKSTVTHVIRISACRVFGVLQIFQGVPGHDRSSLKNQQLDKIPILRVTRGFREIGPVQAITSELPTASE